MGFRGQLNSYHKGITNNIVYIFVFFLLLPSWGCCYNQDLDDHSKYEQKWNAQIIEPKKTPDLENMDLEQYQVNNVSYPFYFVLSRFDVICFGCMLVFCFLFFFCLRPFFAFSCINNIVYINHKPPNIVPRVTKF